MFINHYRKDSSACTDFSLKLFVILGKTLKLLFQSLYTLLLKADKPRICQRYFYFIILQFFEQARILRTVLMVKKNRQIFMLDY